MNITHNNTDTGSTTLEISIVKADYEESLTKELKEIKRKTTIKGFRQGNVPWGIINRMYKPTALSREIDKLLSDKIPKYFEEKSINIFGQPIPNNELQEKIAFDKQENFNFTYDIGILPEVEYPISKKNNFVLYNIEIDNKILDEKVEQYRKTNGDLTRLEKVETEECFVYGEITYLDNNHHEIEGKEKVPEAFILPHRLGKQKTQIIGKTEGEEIILDPKDIEQQELAYILGIKKEEIEDFQGTLKFVITKITHIVPAELNNTLFKTVYPDADITSLDDFKEKIKKEVKKEYHSHSNQKLLFDVEQYLVKNTPLNLPEEFIKKWILLTQKEEQKENDIDTLLERFLKNLKWQLITRSILYEKKIEVTEEEVKNHTRKNLQAYFKNLNNDKAISDEEIDGYVNIQLQDKKNVDKIQNIILTDKLIKIIVEETTIKEKQLTQSKFQELIEKENKM